MPVVAGFSELVRVVAVPVSPALTVTLSVLAVDGARLLDPANEAPMVCVPAEP